MIAIGAAAAFASLLTFFTGFGLATILTPVMLVFFPAPAAIALTAIVHFLNNIFKYALLRTHIDWRTVARFGLPAGLGAILGAVLLGLMPQDNVLTTYTLSGKIFSITPLRLVVGLLMVAFALFEAVPRLRQLEFSAGKIYAGGFISGFFGGLSGHQGALRSAFLIRAGLTKEVFIATGIAIACIVDAVRLILYRPWNVSSGIWQYGGQLAVASGAAFAGAILGNLLLKKTGMKAIQVIVAVGICIIGVLVAGGII